jgi:hypothetical protein
MATDKRRSQKKIIQIAKESKNIHFLGTQYQPTLVSKH